MSLAGWFTTVHPSGGTRVEMLEQERIAVARGGRMVYIDLVVLDSDSDDDHASTQFLVLV